MESGAVLGAPPVHRHLGVDERGVGLQATWRPRHGFVNMSLWREDRCVETFRLTPSEAARLVGFLADSLASGVPAPEGPQLRCVGDPPARARRSRIGPALARTSRDVRAGVARGLEELARRVR